MSCGSTPSARRSSRARDIRAWLRAHRATLTLATAALIIESVLLYGMWLAGREMWDLAYASRIVRILGYAGLFGHAAVDLILAPFIQNLDSYPVVLAIYGVTNCLLIGLLLAYGRRLLGRWRPGRR